MNPEPPTEDDLRIRFAALREAEAGTSPSFSTVLAAARRPVARDRPSILVPFAAAVMLGLVLVPILFRKPAAPASLVESLPVLLEPARATSGFPQIPPSTLATVRMPSDTMLPFHLSFEL